MSDEERSKVQKQCDFDLFCKVENGKKLFCSLANQTAPNYFQYDVIIPLIQNQHPAAVEEMSKHLLEIVGKHWESQGKRIDWNRDANLIMATLSAKEGQLVDALLIATGRFEP